MSYPDVSLIPDVCRALSITEHEFFIACDDDKAHEQARAAEVWQGVTRGWFIFFAAAYAVATLACFICNLAIYHTLDWFWIVLTSLMLAFSFTNLPLLVKKNRLGRHGHHRRQSGAALGSVGHLAAVRPPCRSAVHGLVFPLDIRFTNRDLGLYRRRLAMDHELSHRRILPYVSVDGLCLPLLAAAEWLA